MHWDIWNAGAIVFRHNSVTNCLVTAHGVSHDTTVIGAIQNILSRTAGSGGTWENGTRLFHHQGSGEILAWGNTFVHTGTISGTALSVTHYRSAPPDVAGYSTSLGQCNGTQARDGDFSPTGTYFGYPCWMQPGRAPLGDLQCTALCRPSIHG